MSGRPQRTFRLTRDDGLAVRIGDAHGRIAIYVDETGANDLRAMLSSGDTLADDIDRAIEVAYPDPDGA